MSTPPPIAAAGDGPVPLTKAQHSALRELVRISPVTGEIGRRFEDADEQIALVGGPVRDALLGRLGNDLDFSTSARPDVIERLVTGWADAIWDMGRAYGTIGCRKGNTQIEITTFRSDVYDPSSRKPAVDFGDTLEGDLSRRDFTVNSMAVRLPDGAFVDPYGGLRDLTRGVLRTPVTAAQSFDDDPLRMLRGVRFMSQLGFSMADDVASAITQMADRVAIVSAERVRDEIDKLLLSASPRAGLDMLVRTGLAEHVLPELPALMLERDEHHRHKDVYEHSLTVLEQAIALEDRLASGAPDLVIRLAALLHDIGKPRTRRFGPGGVVTFHHHDVVGATMARKRLKALRYSNEIIDQVCTLVELHLRFHGYGSGEWSDSAVRRYVRDAGDQLTRLHVLTRADCTTRNSRKAQRLQRTYDHLEDRIAVLGEAEELAALRPDLDGNQIMQVLGVGPGREVGEAYRYLLELRMDRGPLGGAVAADELRAWWARRATPPR